MKFRAIRKERLVVPVLALIFAIGLVAVNAVWPTAFGVVIAIGGLTGAVIVAYEVRLTKRLAQAEFVRDLQTGFASDPNISELWRKMLLKEDVTFNDRGLVSSYLTFFETLHLLLQRDVLDLALIDNLFRNRFFTAVGNPGVLATALAREPGSFANIHHLIVIWHDFLLAAGIPMHAGYFRYVKAMVEVKGYSVEILSEEDFQDLKDLQTSVLSSLTRQSMLRENSDDMLRDCLTCHTVLGVRWEGALVAGAILFDGGQSTENIRHYLTSDPEELKGSINLKLVLVHPDHRTQGLGRSLVELLEKCAVDFGKKEIMCTIHPGNEASESLFKRLGYGKLETVMTPYGKRSIFVRRLPRPNKHWAR